LSALAGTVFAAKKKKKAEKLPDDNSLDQKYEQEYDEIFGDESDPDF